MLVEPLVLGGDERDPDIGRHFRERHHGAALEAEIGDEPAVGRVDLGGLVGVVPAEVADGGATVAGACPGIRRDDDGETKRHQREGSDQEIAAGAGRERDAHARALSRRAMDAS